jgi:hypothetical protein
MTVERRIFILWLAASDDMGRSSDMRYNYFLGKVTAFVEAYAEIRGVTFVEASRELMNLRDHESIITSAA